MGTAVATNSGAQLIRDGARAVLLAAVAIALLSLVGLLLACCAPSAKRGVTPAAAGLLLRAAARLVRPSRPPLCAPSRRR